MIGKGEKCEDPEKEFWKQGWPEAKPELGTLSMPFPRPLSAGDLPMLRPTPLLKDLCGQGLLTCNSA